MNVYTTIPKVKHSAGIPKLSKKARERLPLPCVVLGVIGQVAPRRQIRKES